ncbi:MAG TPA: hypothetical protein PLI09_05260 [Candidatus Hydrogenedentes bacterium]|nr:hypothetical protein [Candidatus Hydrogenedentota bacterium]
MFSFRGMAILMSVLLLMGPIAHAQPVSFERLRALGDSLTICTQGGIMSDHRTQVKSWVVLVANQMGTTMRLPLLEEMNAIGQQRRMDYPDYGTIDCYAYNGVSTDDTFQKHAEEIPWYQFGWNWNHLELILAGKVGYSMVQALVEDNPTFVIGFLGSNDFMERVMAKGTILEGIPTLGLVDEIDPLDARDMRPQDLFRSDFDTMVTMMYKPGVGMCFGTLPMLPDIPGILNKQELTDFIGENPLPEDCFTNYTVAAAVWGGLKGAEIMADDRNYYTPEELQTINDAIVGYNNTIRELAADPAHPFAVAETPIQSPEITNGTCHVNGWRVNNRLFINNLGKPRASIMTTDGVHMTDIGNAMCAQAYIRAINQYYGTSIPELSEEQLTAVLNNDPFVDNDADGRIEGLSCGVFFLTLNFVYGDRATNDSDEVPRNAKLLTAQASPASCGNVTTDSEGPEYWEGATVVLTATPEGEDSVFMHWEGDVPDGMAVENPLTVVMDAHKTIVAVFDCVVIEGEGEPVECPVPCTAECAGTGMNAGSANALIDLYANSPLGLDPNTEDADQNGMIDLAHVQLLDLILANPSTPVHCCVRAAWDANYALLDVALEEAGEATFALVAGGRTTLQNSLTGLATLGDPQTRIVLNVLLPLFGISLDVNVLDSSAGMYLAGAGDADLDGVCNLSEYMAFVTGPQDFLGFIIAALDPGIRTDPGYCGPPCYELPEGETEGQVEGQIEGLFEGVSEGVEEGQIEGLFEGMEEGELEGELEGLMEGQEEGLSEGAEEGLAEGINEGEGIEEGLVEGVNEGVEEGALEEGEGGEEGEGSLEGEGVEEGVMEGQQEGLNEGEGVEEGGAEGILEGLEEGEGGVEGEGAEEGQPEGEHSPFHAADQNGNNLIDLSELLRIIQFYNSDGIHCQEGTEDGYAPGPGGMSCAPHDSDYSPQDWYIGLTELLRMIQFYNSDGYYYCPDYHTEDGFCPGVNPNN